VVKIRRIYYEISTNFQYWQSLCISTYWSYPLLNISGLYFRR